MRMQRIFLVSTFLLPCAFLDAGEEYVYEGKTAAEWAKELKATDSDGAKHALVVLGKEAIPALVALLKDPDQKTRATALAVFANAKLDKDGAAAVLPLLKDDSYEVRRAAVRVLGRFINSDPAARAALEAALNDRDKAVAEAAEQVLTEVAGRWERFEALLGEAKTALAAQEFQRAAELLRQAEANAPDTPKARERLKELARVAAERGGEGKPEKQKLDERVARMKEKEAEAMRAKMDDQRRQQLEILMKQARVMTEKGDFDNAQRILRETAKLYPDDPRVAEGLKRMEERMKERKERGGGADKEEPRRKGGPDDAPRGDF